MQTLIVETPRLRTHCWVQGPANGNVARLMLGHIGAADAREMG